MLTERWPLRHARTVILKGGVIAYPTEAVFGLGCDPRNETAVRRIIALKARDAGKGLILIASSIEQLLPFLAPFTDERRAQFASTWPGPVTWVVPAKDSVSSSLSGGRDTLAVRVTAHPIARALCEITGMALVSTSANKSGHPPLRTALQVRRHFHDEIDYIVPGECGGARKPTEIRDARTGKILRAG